MEIAIKPDRPYSTPDSAGIIPANVPAIASPVSPGQRRQKKRNCCCSSPFRPALFAAVPQAPSLMTNSSALYVSSSFFRRMFSSESL